MSAKYNNFDKNKYIPYHKILILIKKKTKANSVQD